ncbi:hypothetical protein SAMN02799624_05411 [Paenibacillus sp. UNC496MF]|uniref:hypothetical protein n=1 Tax=Paenibacillus sp. UNC496MF TaxID=1502753 RepID=UPI0008DEEE5F|nr:hypothetical protein [Paenibacillus sp. UNC496MF]SFJ65692.1 hypothetical protein SAMN02799624_05411 [Paenibacillus sp. UNC496MF]
MRMPTSKGGGARFRGPTSSQAYNQNEDDKYLEMVELYRQSNQNLQSLTEAHQIVLAENTALGNYIMMLERRMGDLETKLLNMEASAPYDPIFFKTGFIHDMTAAYPNISQENGDTSLRCDIDMQNRCALVPLIHLIPKTHTVNEKTGEVVIPSELELKVGRTNTKGTVVDNNLLNCFNGDNESYWQRTVTYNFADCPDQEDVIIELTLPSHLVNNLNINEITIHPHPERGVQIKNVEIQYQNAWQQIDGFLQQDLAAISSYEYSPRKRWVFSSVPVQKIRVTLVQKNPLDINGKKVFILGAQEIGVFLSLFEPGGGIILTPFEMDGLYNIESVEHVFLNRTAFGIDLDHDLEGRVLEYDILKEMDDGMLTPIRNTEWSGQSAVRLWVRTKLIPYNGVNPCLHAVKINYSR